MLPYITVLPQKGYLNTTFGFKLTGISQKFDIVVCKEGQLVSSKKKLDPADSIFHQFKEPGSYSVQVTCVDGTAIGGRFEVGDASQLGGSVLNYVHADDDNPVVLLVKKDRTVVYDAQSHQRFEMLGVSPTRVVKLNKNFLLFETLADRSNQVCNYGFFDTRKLEFSHELPQAIWVAHDTESGVLVIEETLQNRLAFIEVKNDGFIDYSKSRFFSGRALGLSKHSRFVVCQDEHYIRVLNIQGTRVCHEFARAEKILIDGEAEVVARFAKDAFEVCRLEGGKFHQVPLEANYNLELRPLYIHQDFKAGNVFLKPKQVLEKELRRLASLRVWDVGIEMGGYFEVCDDNAQPYEKTSYGFFSLGSQMMVKKTWTKEVYAMAKCRKSKYHLTQEQILWEFNSMPEAAEQLSYHFLEKEPGIASGLEGMGNLEITYTGDASSAMVFSPSREELFVFGPGSEIYRLPAAYAHSSFFRLKNKKYYLLREDQEELELVRLEGEDVTQQALFSGKILERDYLERYGILWFKTLFAPKGTGPLRDVYIYDIQNKVFRDSGKQIPGASPIEQENGKFTYPEYSLARQGLARPDYYLCQSSVFVCLEPFGIKSAVAGKVVGYSPALNRIVSFRDDDGYYLFSYEEGQGIYIPEKIEGSQPLYKESELLPNGKSVLLKTSNSNCLEVYDIAKDEVVSFFTGRFLSFSNEGNIIIEEDMSRTIKVFDPNTFEDITPAQFHFYRYQSPDAKLYSQMTSKSGYYHFLENRDLNQEEFELIASAFDRGKDEGEREFDQRIVALYSSYNKRYVANINSATFRITDRYQIAAKVAFIQIGITGTEVVAWIPSKQLSYYNCLSFSYDNRYVGLVGKPYGDGMFQLYKIDFDEMANTLKVIDRMVYEEPNKATWICSFSANGYFGTYDSNPTSFFMNVSDRMFEEKYRFAEEGGLQIVHKKSFECFSNSGALAALSEKGYSPMSLGGCGHQASRELHVYDLQSGKVVISYPEHGAEVKFAAFSADDKRLLSRSEDGVIIVRNVGF